MTSGRRTAVTAALVVAIAAWLLSHFQVIDQDVFWHLAAGRRIIETGRLLTVNTFSSLFPGHPWFNPEWGFQVLLAGTWNLGGWAGVSILKGALAAGTAVALFAVLMSARSDVVVALGITVAAMAGMRPRMTERPQLLSVFLFTLVALAVERYRRGERRWIWGVPVIILLWGNTHGEVTIGLLYLAGMAAGSSWTGGGSRLAAWRRPPGRRSRPPC